MKKKLSNYDFYQFWRNVNDSDVPKFINLFTKLPIEERKKLSKLKEQEINEAKKILAYEVTKITRGIKSAKEAEDIANNIFNKKTLDERIINSTGEGNGPVNALDNALRKDLGIYNQYIQDLTLVDYKVRILDGGTEAITRVVIESSDSKNQSWFTVGISPNIIEASFEALMDSINYKLIKSDIK